MNKKKGILFWITGLSGSGKTTLAKRILPFISRKCGATVHLDGDSLRKILELYGYSFEDRLSNSRKFTKIAKLLTDQGINVVFSLVGLMNKPRNWNRKNIKNYIEIFIICWRLNNSRMTIQQRLNKLSLFSKSMRN